MAYTNAIYFLKYNLGNDAARTDLVPSAYADNGSGLVRVTVGSLGTPAIVTGAIVAIAGTTGSVYVGNWKVTVINSTTIDLQASTYTSNPSTKGTLIPFGGDSWDNGWNTFAGATAARLAPGDVVKISKSPAPVNIGDGVWTDQPATLPSSKSITSTVNSSGVVKVNCTGHGFSTGDCVYIQDHASAVNAAQLINGCWSITYVDANSFTLDGSTYVIDGGATGNATNVNRAVVKIATPLTITVERCQGLWTAANSATITRDTSVYKDGDSSLKLVKASPANSTLYAFAPTGALNLSSKQTLTFWIRNETAILANQWMICLCSGADGTGVQNTFKIPAIPSTGRFLALNLNAEEGANLYNGINSIAIYSGTSAGTTTGIYFNNFMACSSLNLQSLISKNTLEQGSASSTGYANEGWYGIKNISQDGKVIFLDQDTNTIANYRVTSRGIGYSGGGGTFATYIRETIKTALASSSSTVVNDCLDSGNYGNYIEYQGGYDTSSGEQTGETFLDGLNGNGRGVQLDTRIYNKLNYLNFSRYNTAVYTISSSNISILTINNLNNNLYAVYSSSTNNVLVSLLSNVCNNGSYGFYFSSSANWVIDKIIRYSQNTQGPYFSSSSGFIISNFTYSSNNNNYGFQFIGSSNNLIVSPTTSNNATGGIIYDFGINFLRNATINETTEFVGIAYSQGILWSYDHDGQAGNHWGFLYGATINWQTVTKHGTDPGSWCTAIGGTGSTTRLTDFPVKFRVFPAPAKTANEQRTVTVWVKKDHATNVGCRLVVYADTLLGITEDSHTKADDTDWQQLTVHFTPTRAKVVVGIYLETWYVAGNSNTYVGSVALS